MGFCWYMKLCAREKESSLCISKSQSKMPDCCRVKKKRLEAWETVVILFDSAKFTQDFLALEDILKITLLH